MQHNCIVGLYGIYPCAALHPVTESREYGNPIHSQNAVTESRHSVNKLKLTPQEFENNAHKV